MKNLIATCGTSILTNSKEVLNNILGDKKIENLTFEEIKKIEVNLFNKLKEYEPSHRVFGAEINSINLMINENKIGKEKIYLIISDSVEGVIAGNLIKRILLETLDIEKIEICKIENLTITKEHDFARKGLKNLSSKMAEIINRYPTTESLVISPIGGFKAQIFIVGLMAQIYKIKAYYLYEGSERLIELLPLPITLDTEILKRNIEIVLEIRKNDLIEKNELLSYLKKDAELKTFLEEAHIDGVDYYSLSALGTLAFDKLNLELKSFLPKASSKTAEEKSEIFFSNKSEPNSDRIIQTPAFQKILSTIFNVSFVEKVVINYLLPRNKGNIIRLTKSSNKLEGRVLYFEYNTSNGMLGGNIFITENSDEDKVDAALSYLSDVLL